MREHLIWNAKSDDPVIAATSSLVTLSPFFTFLLGVLIFAPFVFLTSAPIASEYLIVALAAHAFVFFGTVFSARPAERHPKIFASIIFAVFFVGLAFSAAAVVVSFDELSEMLILEEQRFAQLSCPAMSEEIIESHTSERKMQIYLAKCR